MSNQPQPAAMRFKIEESAETKNLWKALLKFSEVVQPLVRSTENPHFKSDYADLADVMRVARPAMCSAGLVLSQGSEVGEDGSLFCVSKLVHAESGEWLRMHWPVLTQRFDSQGVGSGYTYARRYSAQTVLGLAPEDDDGEASQDRDTRPVAKASTNAPSSHDVEQMIAAFAKIDVAEAELQEMIGGPLAGVTAQQFQWLKREFAKRRDAQRAGGERDEAARVLATTTRPMARNGKVQP